MRSTIVATFLICACASTALAQLRADRIVTGLTQPVAFVQDPSDPTVQVIVQQNGRVRVMKSGVLQATDFIDLRSETAVGGESGLLGLAFAPDYATSRRFFVNFTNLQGHTVIARFERSTSDPLRADPTTRFDLRWPTAERFIRQPFPNHNGGNIAFGPDGFLYIGLGDGGSANDPLNLAQNPQSLLGKMLRINVAVPASDAEGYDVPTSNPFINTPGVLGELWSFGLRNPWRWSFDNPARGGTGALIMGDVGQGAWEEVDYEPAGRGGRNYGWPIREGAHNNVSAPPFSQPLVDPTFEYTRSSGGSITGGFVYRGSALGLSFRGRYLFGDFISSRVWSIQLTINSLTGEATASDLREHTIELGAGSQLPSGFGVDASGEIYVVNYSGSVHRIASTIPLPVSPRSRPPNIPATGFAVARPNNTTVGPAAQSQPSAVPEAPAVSPAALPTLVVADRANRRWLIVLTRTGPIAFDLEDDSKWPALLRFLIYVRAGSMSTEIWRQRP